MPHTDPNVSSEEPEFQPPTPGEGAATDAAAGLAAEACILAIDESFTLDRMFTAREAELVTHLILFAREGAGEQSHSLTCALNDGFRRLGAMALALEAYPAIGEHTSLGDTERSRQSLVHTLELGGGHAVEWSLPTKAILSRTFGIAKVNFWTSLRYIIQGIGGDPAMALHSAIEEAVEEAVYTRLAEELYGSFAASQTTSPQMKRVAIDHMIDLWEGRVRFATYKFCPILRSAWSARQRAPRVFGTMLGANELFTLLFQDCDERFLDVFTEGDADIDMLRAFEEFLFDLPFESLELVRERMQVDDRSVVSPDEVAEMLGFSAIRPKLAGAKELYSSFRRRRVKAQYRTSMHVPGPTRTAESYVLEALLEAEERDAKSEGSAGDRAGG